MTAMGLFERLLKRIDKPADQSLLLRDGRRAGSERIIKANSPDQAKDAAADVRRRRAKRTRRGGW